MTSLVRYRLLLHIMLHRFSANAGPWLVNWFVEVFFKTISPNNFILDIDNLLDGIWIAVAYHYAGVIFRWILASDWSIPFRAFISATTHHIAFMLELWTHLSDLINVPSCSSDFLHNASLWLVDSFMAFFSTTTHHISFILKLWTH